MLTEGQPEDQGSQISIFLKGLWSLFLPGSAHVKGSELLAVFARRIKELAIYKRAYIIINNLS